MSMSRRDTIAEAILASRALFHRYLPGFDDSNHTRQAPCLPNHVAWCLGHCALTLHRGVERINHEPLPETDFHTTPADLPGRSAIVSPPGSQPARATPMRTAMAGTVGFGAVGVVNLPSASPHAPPSRFDTETVAFQSTPVDNPTLYPRFDRCVDIFDAACHRYASVVRALPEDRLDAMIQWGQIQIPVWASGLRMAFHNGTHSGQISDLRRALGMKSIFA
jgi:hypothetical protein